MDCFFVSTGQPREEEKRPVAEHANDSLTSQVSSRLERGSPKRRLAESCVSREWHLQVHLLVLLRADHGVCEQRQAMQKPILLQGQRACRPNIKVIKPSDSRLRRILPDDVIIVPRPSLYVLSHILYLRSLQCRPVVSNHR